MMLRIIVAMRMGTELGCLRGYNWWSLDANIITFGRKHYNKCDIRDARMWHEQAPDLKHEIVKPQRFPLSVLFCYWNSKCTN